LSEQPVALITGASRGIGRALALEFARAGYFVAANAAHSIDTLQELVKEIQNNGDAAASYTADIGNKSEVQRMIATLAADRGRIDAVVNNAGIVKNNLVANLS